MQTKTLAVLAFLLTALLLWAFLVEPGSEEERNELEAGKTRIFAVEEGKVGKVSLTSPMGKLTLQKGTAPADPTSSGWRIKEPKDLPADPTAADALANAVRGLLSSRTFEATGGTLKDFGLDETALVVTFEAEGYAGPSSFHLGKSTPLNDGRYLQVEGETRIHIVPTAAAQAFEKKMDDLRDMRLASFSTGQVEKLTLRGPSGTITLVKEGESWILPGPPKSRVDRGAVQSLLSDLSTLKAQTFPDPVPESAGLAAPTRTALVDLGATGGILELQFGAEVEGMVYARRGKDGEVALVPLYVLEAFQKTPVAWQSLAVTEVNAWMANLLEGTIRNQKLTAKKGEDEAWKLTLGTTAETDLASARASDLLREITELKGVRRGEVGVPPRGPVVAELHIAQPNGPASRFRIHQEEQACEAMVEGDQTPLPLADCKVMEFLDGFLKDPQGNSAQEAPVKIPEGSGIP